LRHTAGPAVLVGFHFFGTSDEVDLPEALLSRLFCHALLQHLPDAGLGEAVETLSEMWRFYHEMPATPALPEPVPSRPVRNTGTVDAPVFPVTEE
jgi:hypothetical protein